ncbi:MAG: type III-A CRISPR-associated RAMP protein Csm5 [Haliscomenobacter sp.]|nr:type III-A CRISPR-associated RAMP protein Csm5 [Haliscomenobacter sp.]
MGIPYLPGSSIKGAIRTAIFSETLMEKYRRDGLPEAKLGRVNRYSGKFKIEDTILQQEVFGMDPNRDWMRMLQVGDCYFRTGTHAAFAETLNERGTQRYEIKGEVRQLIEYLPAGTTGEFQLTIPETHRSLIARKEPTLFRATSQILNLPALFKLIHDHSLRLLDDEIAFFDEADLPSEAEGLSDFLADLRATAKGFSDNECLLRLGFGTGYRNMTGDWVKDLIFDDGLYDDIASATRRTPKYNHMPLPKSRKIMFDGVMMGFVKLTF